MWWLASIGTFALGLLLARRLLNCELEPWESRWDPRRVDPRRRTT